MKVAFLFPGQGSQKVGMGADLYENMEAARAMFDRADASLGFELSTLCFHGPEEDLRQTINTQPALYVTSCAALEALRSRFDEDFVVEPFAVAGHSVGEYAALYAAGVVDFEKGLALVRRRAELMHAAALAKPGAMTAILGLDAEPVREACEQARSETKAVVAVANYNSPGQIVISGEAAGVERAGEIAKQKGAKRLIPLAVSGAFHSPLMVSAGDALYNDLREAGFRQATVPVVVNVTAEYNRAAADFAPFLTMQVSGSVRWEESMRRLLDDGVDTFVEIGSGEVLAGLLKRIDKSARALNVQDSASLDATVALLREWMEPEPDSAAPSPSVIYHITRRDAWEQAAPSGSYAADSLDAEGFIHCSTHEQVAASANNHFRARHGLVLLTIDPARVQPEIRYEAASNGQLYPHIHGPLNVDAVTAVTDFEPGPDGRFTPPTEAARE
jgi:[acyl-carrier-protein] S-malonyltransferase